MEKTERRGRVLQEFYGSSSSAGGCVDAVAAGAAGGLKRNCSLYSGSNPWPRTELEEAAEERLNLSE